MIRFGVTLILWMFFAAAIGFAQNSVSPLPSYYFQQEVNYIIRVKLDDQSHYLTGSEEFTYKNNSSSVLQELYIHLYPNAYLNNKTAYGKQETESGSTDFHFAKEDDRGFIDSLDFRINGIKVGLNYVDNNRDVVRIPLPAPLMPGQSLTVTTPFRVQIPKSFSRLGHVEQQYQITQWYPKPAVFDHKGWHPMPYLDQGEFYSEFGTYDVYITLPRNYVLGATGELIDGEEELRWMKKRQDLSNKLLREETKETNVVFPEEFKSNDFKTLHFRQSNIHDFAWFCDKQYYVQMSEVELPESKRKVKTIALFNERDKSVWKSGTKHLNDAVYYYSKFVGEYPYNICTAVDGALSAGGGMEYPMITVVAAGGSEESLKQVIVHEVGHNWFYGILASNERIHPWQDEGMNSYVEGRSLQAIKERNEIGKPKKEKKGLSFSINTSQVLDIGFKYAESFNNDQPIDDRSENYSTWNYGIIVYAKTAMAFRNLQSYLGTERFDKCMHAYYDKWKFKHPYPEDVQAVFEEVSGENLSWFFQDYFQSHERIEFKAGLGTYKNQNLSIVIENRSERTLPAFVALKDENLETVDTFWTKSFIGTHKFDFKVPSGKKFKYVEVNSGQKFPEMNPNNNVFKVKYNFDRSVNQVKRKCATLSFRPIWRPESAFKRYVFYSPAIGYNTRDGFMAGLGFYYQPFPKRKFEFHGLPMYGFNSKKFVGSMGATYRIFTEGRLKKVEFKTRTALFADFLHTKNFIEFHVQPKRMRNKLSYIYSLNSYHIGTRAADCNGFKFENGFRPYYVSANVHYLLDKVLYKIGLDAEIGAHSTDAVRAFVAPKLIFNYTKKGEVHLRMFAGRFMSNRNVPVPLRFGLSGSFDPFGEHVMIDRPMFYDDRPQQSTWLNRQIIEDQGFFKTFTGVTTSKWLLSFNGAVSLPNTRNIRLFGNLGVVPYDPISSPAFANPIWKNNDKVQTFYDAGISLHFFSKVLNIYLPLAGSVYQNGTPHSFKDFHQNITFSLKINELVRKYLN